MKGEVVKTQDRIIVSFSKRIGLPNYSHYDVFVSYGSDVSEGEGVDKAFRRIERQALKQFEASLEAVGDKR